MPALEAAAAGLRGAGGALFSAALARRHLRGCCSAGCVCWAGCVCMFRGRPSGGGGRCLGRGGAPGTSGVSGVAGLAGWLGLLLGGGGAGVVVAAGAGPGVLAGGGAVVGPGGEGLQ